MDRWSAPDSIFAPLILVGQFMRPHGPGVGNALLVAARTIPATSMTYKAGRGGGIRRTQEEWSRRLVTLTGNDAVPYIARAALVDLPPGTSPQPRRAAFTQWEVGVRTLKAEAGQPISWPGSSVGLLELTISNIGPEGVSAGPQLALLRHLWFSALKAADPQLVAIGGQHEWNDSWWRIASPTP